MGRLRRFTKFWAAPLLFIGVAFPCHAEPLTCRQAFTSSSSSSYQAAETLTRPSPSFTLIHRIKFKLMEGRLEREGWNGSNVWERILTLIMSELRFRTPRVYHESSDLRTTPGYYFDEILLQAIDAMKALINYRLNPKSSIFKERYESQLQAIFDTIEHQDLLDLTDIFQIKGTHIIRRYFPSVWNNPRNLDNVTDQLNSSFSLWQEWPLIIKNLYLTKPDPPTMTELRFAQLSTAMARYLRAEAAAAFSYGKEQQRRTMVMDLSYINAAVEKKNDLLEVLLSLPKTEN